MLKFAERLKELRKSKDLSQQEFAKYIKVSKSSVNMYERGEREPGFETLEAIADFFNVDLDYLLGKTSVPNKALLNNPQSNFENIPGARPVTVKRIPLFAEISCGEPIYASDDVKCYIPVGDDIEADFCVIANGDSMTGARINDGDIVFIKKVNEVKNGEIAAVWIDGDGALLKRVYIQDDVMSLVSENPKYPPRVYSAERAQEVRLLGKAIAFQSSVE